MATDAYAIDTPMRASQYTEYLSGFTAATYATTAVSRTLA